MNSILTAITLALNFFPGYKTKAGAVVLVGVAVATAYNSLIVPQFGLPPIPAEYLGDATVIGNAVLGVGVANRIAK